MKKSRSFLLVLLFAFSINYGQEITNQNILNSRSILTFDENDKTVQGTPYLNDEFAMAKISVDNSKNYSIRYNLVTDDMEVQNEKNEIFSLNKNISGIFVTFLDSGTKYEVFEFLNDKGSVKNGYFINLTSTDKKIKLLSKSEKIFVKSKPTTSSYQKSTPARFKRNDDKFYIKINEKDAIELKQNKKKIASIFPKHESEILKFIKKNSIKVSKKDGLIKLFDFINTL